MSADAPFSEKPELQGQNASAEQERSLEELVASLQAQTSILRATIDGIADAVLVADEHGTCTHANKAAEPFINLSASRVAELDWRAANNIFRSDGVTPLPPDELPLGRALRGERVDDEEIFTRSPGETEGVWLSVSGRPIHDQGGLSAARSSFSATSASGSVGSRRWSSSSSARRSGTSSSNG